MNLSFYLLLSKYIPLPLSALKIVEKDKDHPFRSLAILTQKEIEQQLIIFNKTPGISIKNIKEKVLKIQNLIQNDFIEKIDGNLNRWNKSGIKIIRYFDNSYPKNLKGIKDAPKIITYQGDFNLYSERSISIIGTRNPTDYGIGMARKIGSRFGELGFLIVNGFAKGIDTHAIKGALAVGGKIIGVLGSGLLHIYPKENKELFFNIVQEGKGVFISEHLPDDTIKKSTLAARNRISSALSLGNIVIEAGKGSGTRWQVEYGKEQGKPIIVLKPKGNYEQAYLPNYIIEHEKNCFIIENIDDVDNIANSILELNKEKKEKHREISNKYQKTLSDF